MSVPLPAPSSVLCLLWGSYWSKFCLILQIYAVWPKSKQNGSNPCRQPNSSWEIQILVWLGNLSSGLLDLLSGFWDTHLGLRDPDLGLLDPDSGLWDPESSLKDLNPGLREPNARLWRPRSWPPWPTFWLQKPRSYIRMDGWTDSFCLFQDFVPFRAAALLPHN